MATLTVQTITRSGTEPTYNAAGGSGDEFSNNGRVSIHVVNNNASACTVTITTPGVIDTDLAIADRTVSVPASEERWIGPFPTGTYNDSSGNVALSYSVTTSVTVALFTMG